jgi:uncharacterized membrane protein YgcG
MDWLIHSPIAHTDGHPFLWGDIAMIALVIIAVAYGRVRSHDKTGLGVLPPVQSRFNPYELAYLRGGKNEVIRAVVYVLNQRGLVEIVRPKWRPVPLLVERAAGRGAEELTELEVRVLESLHCSNMPVEATELLHRELFRDKLESDELLRSDNARRAVSRIWFPASSLTNPRISKRGRAYIKRLQMADAGELAAFRMADPRHDTASVMLVGLFGLEILAGTSDATFARVFAKEPWGSSRSGGASGGGGGGGGGCGGGGCGGGCG